MAIVTQGDHAQKDAMSKIETFLSEIAGIAPVTRDPAERRMMAQDLFSATDPVAAIAAPTSAAMVAAIVGIAARHDVALAVRGGGMSYSGGYLSSDPAGTLLLDMRAMNRIVAIDPQDMYVVVEPGCTWQSLQAALDPLGLRTAFWGTLSGRVATVGGAISQNAIFWGSGTGGSAVDSVLGIETVLADGSIVRTGSFGVDGASPFFRHFGPDLTGLFTADAGAMGIKTRIALRLVAKAAHQRTIAFLLPDAPALCALLSEAARRGLVAQQIGLDSGLKTARMASEGWRSDLGHLAQVMRSGGSVWKGIQAAARMAMAGRGLLDAMPFSAHLFCEGRSEAAVAAAAREARDIAVSLGGREVAATVGDVMHAAPFPPVNGITGPKGERWVPVHCIVPHSRATPAFDAIEHVIADHEAAFEEHGITWSYLFTTIGTNGFVIEPMFFWPDALGAVHHSVLSEHRVARFVRHDDAPAARALVRTVRTQIVSATDALGAVHMQIGQFYPYADRLNPDTRALLSNLRHMIDPAGRISPQSLSR